MQLPILLDRSSTEGLTTQIVVQFKPPAANLFRKAMPGPLNGNRMVIEIAPGERFSLR